MVTEVVFEPTTSTVRVAIPYFQKSEIKFWRKDGRKAKECDYML